MNNKLLAEIHTLMILMILSGAGMMAKNHYIIGGCMVFLAGYMAFYIRLRGKEIHSQPPSDTPKPAKKYTKYINGKDFHFASFTLWGIGEYIRIYCVQTNRYFYARASQVDDIAKWVKGNL
jgi:uncharacterized membrane protein